MRIAAVSAAVHLEHEVRAALAELPSVAEAQAALFGDSLLTCKDEAQLLRVAHLLSAYVKRFVLPAAGLRLPRGVVDAIAPGAVRAPHAVPAIVDAFCLRLLSGKAAELLPQRQLLLRLARGSGLGALLDDFAATAHVNIFGCSGAHPNRLAFLTSDDGGVPVAATLHEALLSLSDDELSARLLRAAAAKIRAPKEPHPLSTHAVEAGNVSLLVRCAHVLAATALGAGSTALIPTTVRLQSETTRVPDERVDHALCALDWCVAAALGTGSGTTTKKPPLASTSPLAFRVLLRECARVSVALSNFVQPPAQARALTARVDESAISSPSLRAMLRPELSRLAVASAQAFAARHAIDLEQFAHVAAAAHGVPAPPALVPARGSLAHLSLYVDLATLLSARLPRGVAMLIASFLVAR
jgi:hypothetical protein